MMKGKSIFGDLTASGDITAMLDGTKVQCRDDREEVMR